MDSSRNLYLSTLDNSIIFWNAALNTGTTIVSPSKGLYEPHHIFLDEENQALYIADSLNNRIAKFYLGIGNLTVVVGGHEADVAVHQFNFHAGVCVLKRDGTIYVADTHIIEFKNEWSMELPVLPS
jgi:DNA-binding beta-propeller fold protein YncE